MLRADDGSAFTSSIANDLADVGRAVVAVRPESVRLTPGDAAGSDVNAVSGRVLRTVFKGQMVSVWIGLAGGTEFVASLPIEDTGATNPQPGETWTARWTADRTLVVREQ